MAETLFERYKEALRAGHVALVRGRLEDAQAAYREAIAIAPDRAVPHVALGGVHLRLGEPDAALASYDAALAIAADDDGALLGRAQALVVLRNTAEAAAVYDRLAAVRAESDRTADAAEAARRALAIEPTEERRARHARLAGLPLEGEPGVPAGAPEPEAPVVTTAEPAVEAEAPGEAQAPGEPLPDPEELVLALEAAIDRGDTAAAAESALAAARAHRAAGHPSAAFDACLQGLGARPGDVDLHLLLAELALDHGWTARAADTYRDLLRLVELDDDPEQAAAVRAAAARHLPDDPRFATA